jgi:predicted AAA+ superfamily ATPase
MPKLYFNDSGILNRIGQISIGHLFENKVFNQLYTKLQYLSPGKFLEEKLNYYQLKSGAEIDFIERKEVGYEVKVTATHSDFSQLEKSSKKLGLKEYKIISLRKTGLVEQGEAQYPFEI